MTSETPAVTISTDAFDGDDIVLPFQTVRSGIMGRIVRLGPLIDKILSAHDYPDGVSQVLGEAIALSALLGTALKFDGNLILQTKSDGPLGLLVANFETPGNLRGYAGYDKSKTEALRQTGRGQQANVLGNGHLAITIDPQGDMERYQGIVALDNQSLVGAAYNYFKQSEQLPTFIQLAVARHFIAGAGGAAGTWHWRAGGLLLQHVSPEGGKQPDQVAAAALEDDKEIPLAGESDDHWMRVRYLAQTAQDHELLDPDLAPDRLLYRLFHEEGVRVSAIRPLRQFCRCSQDRIKDMLRGFGRAQLSDMRDDSGKLSVKCEFCAKQYEFDESEID